MELQQLSPIAVRLEPYSAIHLEKTVEWLNQPFIQQTFGQVNKLSVEAHRAWLAANPDVKIWAIYSDRYVGNLLIYPNLKHRSGYLQIYLGDSKDTGKKIGYHAMQLALDYVFNEMKLHRIWLHCWPENTPAIKLYQKLGFEFEGLERESICRGDQYLSQGRWSLLSHEWLIRKA